MMHVVVVLLGAALLCVSHGATVENTPTFHRSNNSNTTLVVLNSFHWYSVNGMFFDFFMLLKSLQNN
jgi:hypothetical protein